MSEGAKERGARERGREGARKRGSEGAREGAREGGRDGDGEGEREGGSERAEREGQGVLFDGEGRSKERPFFISSYNYVLLFSIRTSTLNK